jgi:parvulin-like peptidyl-prolyl isomerase
MPADKVVATIDGQKVTAGDLREALQTVPADLIKLFQQNPKYAMQQIYLLRHLAGEGEKLGLADQSPVKEQLAAVRANMVAGSMLTYEQNHYIPPPGDAAAYYEANRAKFQSTKVKAILISFSLPVSPNATQEEKARAQAEQALGFSKRSEAEARVRAAEVRQKLKDGADFVKMVAEYSDDAASKAKDGDIGFVTVESAHSDEIKKAVAALEPGAITEPIRQAGNLVIVKVESRSQQTQSEVELWILQELRRDHVKQWFRELTQRFDPVPQDPTLFPAPAPKPAAPAAGSAPAASPAPVPAPAK